MRAVLPILLWFWVAVAWAEPSVAIGRFADHSADPTLAPLGRALPEMLLTDLGGVSGLTLVERARLDEILDELALSQTDAVDPDRAVQVGKLVGATHMVVGSLVAAEPELRIDARVVDVERRAVVATAEVHGPRDEFFLLEKELASRIAEILEVELTARERVRLLSRVQTESLEATLAWGRGLDALDRGEIALAQSEIERSLAADGDFAAAREVLESLTARLDTLMEAQRDAAVAKQDGLLADLVALREADDRAGVARRIGEARGSAARLGARERLALHEAILAAEIADAWGAGQPGTRPTFTESALYEQLNLLEALGRDSDLLATADAFVDRYPDSIYLAGVQQTVRSARQRLEAREAALKEVPAVRAAVDMDVRLLQCRDHPDATVRRKQCIEVAKRAPDRVSWHSLIRAACADGDAAGLEEARALAKAAGDEVSEYQHRHLSDCRSWLGSQMKSWADEAVKTGNLDLYVDQPLSSAGPVELPAMIERMLKRWPDAQQAWSTAVRFSLAHRQHAEARDYYRRFEVLFPGATEDRIHQDFEAAERRAAEAEHPEAYRAYQLAKRLDRISHLEPEQAVAWRSLYAIAPEYRESPGPETLWAAMQAVREARQPNWDLEVRGLLEEVVAAHPESKQAEWAKRELARPLLR